MNSWAAGCRVAAVVHRVTARRLTATVVDAGGASRIVDLGPLDAMIPRVDALREELGDGMALARGRAHRLAEFSTGWGRDLLPLDLFAPGMPDVLVLVPHGLLHDVPLHLIVLPDDPRPLACRAGIAYSSGMSLFTRCAERNPARAGTGPADRGIAAGGVDVLSGRDAMFRGVPHAVAALFGDRVRLVGEQHPGLTRTLFKDAIRDAPDVLLVVAHGYTEPTTASFSGLLLRPPAEVGWEPVDMAPGVTFEVRDRPLASAPPLRGDVRAEVLTAAELSTTALLDSELVVLLACSAGTGRLDEGDSPNNIAETLLRLGASSVVAAMWDADYAATRDWVEVFFEAWLGQGRPKALAARDATRALYETFDGQPERFGALTLRGDWV